MAREELSKRGIAVEVVVTDPVGTQLPPTQPKYKGVRGWLLLFCLSLTLFTPLMTIGSLGAGYSESSKYFDQFPGLQVITMIDIYLSLGVVAFSIYAGTGLWGIRPGAVQMAKRYLLSFLGYHAITSILPFMAGLPSAANEAMIEPVAKEALRGVIYFTVWYLYLNNSKRVKATFPSDLPTSNGEAPEENQSSLPQGVEGASKWRWLWLFGTLFLAQAFVSAAKGEVGHLFIVFIPSALGGGTGVFILAYLLSLFARRENRFEVCCWIAAVIFCLSHIGQLLR